MTHEPVGNGLNIGSRSTNGVVEIVLVHRPRVVAAESLVVVVVPRIQLLQAISGRGTFGTVANHLENAALGVARVECDTSVGLHDTRVSDTVVGGTDTDVAAGFLHNDAKNSAGIDAGLGGDLVDGSLDEADFAGAVVKGHQGGVLGPEGVVAGPGAWVREVGSGAAVRDIATTDTGTAAVAGCRASTAREVDNLADLKGAGVNSRVCGLDGSDGGTVGLSDGPEGVA